MKRSIRAALLLLTLLTVLGLCPASNVSAADNTTYGGVDYSAVYDKDYYLSHNPDVRAAIGDNAYALLAHFVTHGMSEGRQASDAFRLSYYKSQYADLRNAFGNDNRSYYMHYINSGAAEGRYGESPTIYEGVDYSTVYNKDYYYSHNSDVARVVGNNARGLISHFVNNGMREGRPSIGTFDVYYYYNKYSDLRAAFGSDLAIYYKHYMLNGAKEGRASYSTTSYKGVDYSAVYNKDFYYNKYSDLKYAYGDDWYALIKHFVTSGMNECRYASAEFNISYYRNSYKDLDKAYGDNFKLYYLHFMNYGKKEGRKGVASTNRGWVQENGRMYYYDDAGILKSWTGIDVSRHQYEIDWEAVKNDGIDFAIIRCGYGDDDVSQDDAYYAYNVSECERLGIPYGIYLYSYATDETHLQSEISHVLRLAAGHNPEMGVYYDMEDSCLPKDSDTLNQWAYTFLQSITNAGYTAGIYANTYWFNTYLTGGQLDSYDKWVAQYNVSECTYDKKFKMWQYTSKGTVAGINGNVDMDAYLVD